MFFLRGLKITAHLPANHPDETSDYSGIWTAPKGTLAVVRCSGQALVFCRPRGLSAPYRLCAPVYPGRAFRCGVPLGQCHSFHNSEVERKLKQELDILTGTITW